MHLDRLYPPGPKLFVYFLPFPLPFFLGLKPTNTSFSFTLVESFTSFGRLN